MKPLILVVDGDVVYRDALRTCLQQSGFDVAVLYEPCKVLLRVEVERPSLVLMTSGEVPGEGLAVLRMLRARNDEVPVIMLGERSDVMERIEALEDGADDVISKPFNVLEALVRVRRVLKRANNIPPQQPVFKPSLSFNGFTLDFAARTLTFQGNVVPLVPTEYAILNLFTTAPGRVLSKGAIAQRIWPDAPERAASVGVWVHRLRRRIERYISTPQLIETVRTKGYVFNPDPERALDSTRYAARRHTPAMHYS